MRIDGVDVTTVGVAAVAACGFEDVVMLDAAAATVIAAADGVELVAGLLRIGTDCSACSTSFVD